MRINKYMADLGLASRREADALLKAGLVFINGRRVDVGEQVEGNEKIEIKGTQKAKQYLAYYKGRGIITHSPENDEVDIETRIKKDYGLSDIHPVGRLDKDSEGLLILSNDGRITGPLLDPEAEHEKEYEVTVDKKVNNFLLKHLTEGVDIEGYKTKPAKAEKKNDKTFRLILTEGKKHQIRRMCAALGFQVHNLKRVRIMNIEIGKLKPNQFRKLEGNELKTFLKELGVK